MTGTVSAEPACGGICVIIPVLNGWEKTRKCLAALRDSRPDGFKIIVVDHGSTDDTKQQLPEEFPDVIHLLDGDHLWWAGATNRGIRCALEQGAEYVMLLNNDCYLVAGAFAALMEQVLSHPGAVIAPVQRDYRSSAMLPVARPDLIWLGFPGHTGPRPPGEAMQHKGLLDVSLIGGGRGVIIPAEVIKRIGMFDESNLPHYYADHDFFLRCKAAGIPLKVFGGAEVMVDKSTTSLADVPGTLTLAQFVRSLSDRRSHRNISDLKAFFRKHYPVRRLYFLGVGLSFVRYCVVYGWGRARYLLTH